MFVVLTYLWLCLQCIPYHNLTNFIEQHTRVHIRRTEAFTTSLQEEFISSDETRYSTPASHHFFKGLTSHRVCAPGLSTLYVLAIELYWQANKKPARGLGKASPCMGKKFN